MKSAKKFRESADLQPQNAGESVDPPTKITPYRDGPYLIRGPFVLVDQEGNEIEVRRKVIALCRCGRSQTRPFCDGTHKAIGFQAESGSEDSVVADSRRRSLRSEVAEWLRRPPP